MAWWADMKRLCLFALLFALAASAQQSSPSSAYDMRMGLLEEVFLQEKVQSYGMTWEARAIGHTPAITRMASPRASVLQDLVNALGAEAQKQFLANFFHHYLVTGNYRYYHNRQGELIDYASTLILGRLRPLTTSQASLENLREAWRRWLAMTKESPFSFLSPSARDLFFTELRSYQQFVPILGLPQRYLRARLVHPTVGGNCDLNPSIAMGILSGC